MHKTNIYYILSVFITLILIILVEIDKTKSASSGKNSKQFEVTKNSKKKNVRFEVHPLTKISEGKY